MQVIERGRCAAAKSRWLINFSCVYLGSCPPRGTEAPSAYCHARKVIIEEETVPTVNVVDRRETGRLITNGHGSNGHGGNGSNGSNGHGGNGHGGNSSNGHGPNGNGSSEAFN